MKFSYGSGQRPLDGYTIKRGIGRGGFGEVFFALSDGGKEVALKRVHGEGQIELRGVAQCLNLKHPNLVSLYDLRTDRQGDHWVVMEYVAGEPLGVVLCRHPHGLPRELAREWFLGLARAVGYLHDHGIVHRDLKPGNVFLENGMVKVGDYGLSKAISSSQRTAQTGSVGTVHYMAPEISTGNYNKQIDVYAAGVLLYEMLTGHVPFEGESAGEILMKHLTTPPDLSKVPAEYVPVVARALAKNPAQRFASMAEMARAVEAVGQEPARVPAVAATGKNGDSPPMPRRDEPLLTALPAVSRRDQVRELCGSLTLSVLFAAVAVTLWAALVQSHNLMRLGTIFFLTVAASWTILIPGKFWTERRGDSGGRRLVMLILGGVIGLGALWLDGWSPQQSILAGPGHRPPEAVEAVDGGALVSLLPADMADEAGYFSYYALAFFALRWWRMTSRRRPQRFSFAPVLAAGFWGLLLMLLVRAPHWPGALVLVLSAIIVQMVSPWEQPPPPACKRMRLRYA